jgi:hypothetical protein
MVTWKREDLLDLERKWKKRLQSYHDELHILREENATLEGKLDTQVYARRTQINELNSCLFDLRLIKLPEENGGN